MLLGNIVDRDPHAAAILQLLHRLRSRAAKAWGGRVVTLVGHRELMGAHGQCERHTPRLLKESEGGGKFIGLPATSSESGAAAVGCLWRMTLLR